MVWETTAKDIVLTLGANAWVAVALTICGIIAAAVGIVYAIGHALELKGVKQAAKSELMQLVASLVLILLLFMASNGESYLVQLTQNQTEQFIGQVGMGKEGDIRITGGPFAIDYLFLKNMIDCSENMINANYAASQGLIFASTMSFVIDLGWIQTPPSITSLIPSFVEQLYKLEYDSNELAWLSILLYAQVNFLRFIETSMFTIFLPIGIILRTFPPTRGAGAVLMAIAIGLYLIYPLLFSLMYFSSPKNIAGCNINIPMEETTVVKGCPLSPSTVTQVLSEGLAPSPYEVSLQMAHAGVGDIRYAAYLYFLVALGGTFIFIRSAAGILGVDISEIGRSMLKML